MRFLRKKEGTKDPDAAELEAKEALANIKSRGDEVTKVATTSYRLRQENHFKEQLAQIMWGH